MIKKKSIYFLLAILLPTSITAISQELEYVTVQGEIVNSSYKPIAYANIVSQKTNSGTNSDENGKFKIQVLKNDTLIFSAITYQTKKIAVSQLLKEQNYVLLNDIVYMIGEVDIMDLRWKEFNNTIINMKLSPFEQKVLVLDGLPNPYTKLIQIKPNLVSNPISAIYELLKKENIRKRKQARWNNTYDKTWIINK